MPGPARPGRDVAVDVVVGPYRTPGRYQAEPLANSFLRLSHSRQIGEIMKRKIDIGLLPELQTSVGIQGSVKHKEVGGPACAGIAIALIIWNRP